MTRPCASIPTRPTQGREATVAELYVFFWFTTDFKLRYPHGMVLRDREYLTTGVSTGQPEMDIVLRHLQVEFRNIYEMRRNRQLVGSGARPSPDALRPGGARKPDAIGLAVDWSRRAIVCELIEVSTLGQASSTMKEDIEDKLDILRGPVKAAIDADLRLLGERMTLEAREFVAFGSAYIPSAALRQVPLLPVATPGTSQSVKLEWICYWPTAEKRPAAWSPAPLPEPENSPTRGLILYELHTTADVSLVMSMSEVWKRFRKWYQQRTQADAPTLDLIPGLARRYWAETPSDLQIVLAYAAIGLTALLVVTAAVYVAAPVFLGAAALGAEATAATTAASTAATMPQVMTTAYSTISVAFAVRNVTPTGVFGYATP